LIKVAHIISGLGTGGAESTLLRLLSASEELREGSIVISLRDKGAMGERIEALGVSVCCLNLNNFYDIFTAAVKLRGLIKKYEPNVLQGWMYHGSFVAFLANLLSRHSMPVLWNIRHSLYDIGTEKRGTRYVIRMGAFISKYIAQIIYNSNVSATQHQVYGYAAEHNVIIPNGFDCDVFTPSTDIRRKFRSELGITDEILIGIVGRYHPMKDHENFLKAASIIKAKIASSRFVLVGAGLTEENRYLNSLIEKLGLANYVFLLGERRDIPAIMPGLDILASSSSFGEAFPNVIGEAMACGAPCVSTDVGDVAMIIGNTGEIVPAKDSAALAEGIYKLASLSDNERCLLGLRARNRIIENYDLSTVAREYEKLYQSVI